MAAPTLYRSGKFEELTVFEDGTVSEATRLKAPPEPSCEDKMYKLSFKEGDFEAHVKALKTAPYLSAYMLGYSKILMSESFTFISEIGGNVQYTDTDSIIAMMTPEQYEQYAARFVPKVKEFGGMELELTFQWSIQIVPKKYLCIVERDDGTHTVHWKANGIPARHNAAVDIVSKFESVLHGAEEQMHYFSMDAKANYSMTHTHKDATVKIRFICLKGRACGEDGTPCDEDGATPHHLRWWRSETEFKDCMSKVREIGL